MKKIGNKMTKSSNTHKQFVKDSYAKIALASDKKCCCGAKEPDYSIFHLDYASQDGYMEDADLRLGCGLPAVHAGIKKGHSVLDLGSGAGNDVFVVCSIVGEAGKVTGLDFTDEMLNKARKNNDKMGFNNVDFVKGDIEDIPLPENSFDVVISNCVLNLVPDKKRAFSEIRRVLKPEGHFCVSDIVLEGHLPDEMREAAALYAGCISGALQKEEYMKIINDAGFKKVELKEEKLNDIPDEYLRKSTSEEAIRTYRLSGTGIYSITVVGAK